MIHPLSQEKQAELLENGSNERHKTGSVNSYFHTLFLFCMLQSDNVDPVDKDNKNVLSSLNIHLKLTIAFFPNIPSY